MTDRLIKNHGKSDNSASSLVCELKKAKESLIKNKLLINYKEPNYSSVTFKPFNIPKHWEWVYLHEVSIIQEGPGIRKFQYQEEGIQFLTVTNILENQVDLEKSKKYISLSEYNTKYKHFTINRNDIVIACSGGSWGKSAIYDLDDVIILNTSTLRLRFFGDLGDNKYLYYLTKADFFNLQIEDQLSGQQPNFGYSHYSLVQIPIPPLREQQRLVAILDEAFDAISKAKANAEQNLRNAKNIFESYLNSVFSNPGADWEEKKLIEVTSKIGSGATPRGGKESYKLQGISLVRSMNVHDRYFKEDNLALIDLHQAKELDNVTLQVDDVLFNITGASVTRSCIIPSKYLPARVNQHVSIIRPLPTIINPLFLNFLLTSKVYKDQLTTTGEQGATRQAITKFQLENFIVCFPTLSEQKTIVKKLEKLSAETKQLEATYTKKLESLEELKKSILQKAFSGELKTIENLSV